MSIELYRLLAGAITMAASLGALVLAGVALLRRRESASLFMEDHFGYYIVRVIAALGFATVGVRGFWHALDFLLQ